MQREKAQIEMMKMKMSKAPALDTVNLAFLANIT